MSEETKQQHEVKETADRLLELQAEQTKQALVQESSPNQISQRKIRVLEASKSKIKDSGLKSQSIKQSASKQLSQKTHLLTEHSVSKNKGDPETGPKQVVLAPLAQKQNSAVKAESKNQQQHNALPSNNIFQQIKPPVANPFGNIKTPDIDLFNRPSMNLFERTAKSTDIFAGTYSSVNLFSLVSQKPLELPPQTYDFTVKAKEQKPQKQGDDDDQKPVSETGEQEGVPAVEETANPALSEVRFDYGESNIHKVFSCTASKCRLNKNPVLTGVTVNLYTLKNNSSAGVVRVQTSATSVVVYEGLIVKDKSKVKENYTNKIENVQIFVYRLQELQNSKKLLADALTLMVKYQKSTEYFNYLQLPNEQTKKTLVHHILNLFTTKSPQQPKALQPESPSV